MIIHKSISFPTNTRIINNPYTTPSPFPYNFRCITNTKVIVN